MKSLKKKKVIFVSAFGDLVQAVHKPVMWPALQFEVSEIGRELEEYEASELRLGSFEELRCASFIAQSVRRLGFHQSYVALGHPRWLDHMYVTERVSSDS